MAEITLTEPGAEEQRALERGVLAALAHDQSVYPRLRRTTRLVEMVFRAHRDVAERLLYALAHHDPLPPLPPDWRPAADPERDYRVLLAAFQRMAAAAALAKAGEALAQGGSPAAVLAEFQENLHNGARLAAAPRQLPPPTGGGELAQMAPPPMRWALPGLPLGAAGLLSGSDGAGKSFLALELALQAATGVPVGCPPDDALAQPTGPVLYLAGEDDRDNVARRLGAIVGAYRQRRPDAAPRLDPAALDRLRVMTLDGEPFPLMTAGGKNRQNLEAQEDEEAVAALDAAIRAPGAALAILDPLVMFHDLDENDNHAMDRLMRLMIRLARRADCAVLLVHHAGQQAILSGRDDHQAGRGATALAAAARCVYTLRRMTSEEAAARDIPETERSAWRAWRAPKVTHGPEEGIRWLYACADGVPLADAPPAPRKRRKGGGGNGETQGLGALEGVV